MYDTLRSASHARSPRSFLPGCIGILAAGALLLGGLAGCQGAKAVNTTTLAETVTAGEKNVQPLAVPGHMLGEPGTNLVVPSVPGKNVEFAAYYPDGTPRITLKTSRSAVLDVLLSGLNEIDAAKFAEDAAQREWTLGLIDRVITVAQPFLARLNQPPAEPAPGTATKPSLRDELLGLLRDPAVRELLGVRSPEPRPASLPAGGAGTPPAGLGTVINP